MIASELNNIPVIRILKDFCGNPTPFKPIAKLDKSVTITELQRLFSKSTSRRKVVEIKISENNTIQLGENEFQVHLNKYLKQIKSNP